MTYHAENPGSDQLESIKIYLKTTLCMNLLGIYDIL